MCKLFLLSLISAGVLVGCSSSNPLLTQNPDTAAKAISEAEDMAQNATKIYYTSASIYDKCMTDPHNFDNPFTHQKGADQCRKVMEVTAQYLSKMPGFEGVTYDDLMNKQVYQRLGDKVNQQMMIKQGG